MYFDTVEKEDMERVVTELQRKHLLETMERKSDVWIRVYAFLYFFSMVVGVFFFLNWIIWLALAICFGLIIFSKKITPTDVEKEYYRRGESWWQEIEDLETGDMDDRWLFCQLMEAIGEGDGEEMQRLAGEALQSPALSTLEFVRKLQRYTVKK